MAENCVTMGENSLVICDVTEEWVPRFSSGGIVTLTVLPPIVNIVLYLLGFWIVSRKFAE